ncbi:HigA family addiction module antitoxin [Pseudomonas putida]|nr:HigA family addiction module antitoxin [Pseudomonas putida]
MLDAATELRDLRSPPGNRLEALSGNRAGGVSADMALRLSICLDTTPEFWLNLQTAFDLRTAEQQHGDEIIGSVQRLVA